MTEKSRKRSMSKSMSKKLYFILHTQVSTQLFFSIIKIKTETFSAVLGTVGSSWHGRFIDFCYFLVFLLISDWVIYVARILWFSLGYLELSKIKTLDITKTVNSENVYTRLISMILWDSILSSLCFRLSNCSISWSCHYCANKLISKFCKGIYERY